MMPRSVGDYPTHLLPPGGGTATVDLRVPWRIWDAVAALLIGVAFAVASLLTTQIIYLAVGPVGRIPAVTPAPLSTMATALLYVGVLAGVWMLIIRRRDVGWEALGFRVPRPGAVVTTMLFGLVLAAGLAAIVLALAALLVSAGLTPTFRAVDAGSGQSGPLLVVSVLVSLILAPVAEEVLFRGVLYQAVRRLGQQPAAVVSTLAFAALHFQLALVPEFVLLGGILTLVFERTRSLYPVIGLHAAYNAALLLVALHA